MPESRRRFTASRFLRSIREEYDVYGCNVVMKEMKK